MEREAVLTREDASTCNGIERNREKDKGPQVNMDTQGGEKITDMHIELLYNANVDVDIGDSNDCDITAQNNIAMIMKTQAKHIMWNKSRSSGGMGLSNRFDQLGALEQHTIEGMIDEYADSEQIACFFS